MPKETTTSGDAAPATPADTIDLKAVVVIEVTADSVEISGGTAAKGARLNVTYAQAQTLEGLGKAKIAGV